MEALPKPQVPWFDLDSADPYTLRAHQEQTAGQQAYILEQYAAAQRAYLEAKDEADRVFGVAFMRSRSTTFERVNKYGKVELTNTNDETAKHLANKAPEVVAARKTVNDARWTRDVWAGYSRAIATKITMLACLSGIARDELKTLGKV